MSEYRYDVTPEARLARELAFIKCEKCGFGVNVGALQHCEECEPINIIRRLQTERGSYQRQAQENLDALVRLNEYVETFVSQLSGWKRVEEPSIEVVDEMVKKRRRDRS
jgi:hypothetical protein